MIEAYAFLAAFTVQILVMSVLHPAWFIRYFRAKATRLPAERLAQLYPGVDFSLARERLMTQYRAMTLGIAVLALLLLGWLFSYVRRPDWDDDPVKALVTVYFLAAQMLPLLLVVWLGVRFNKEHKLSLPGGKRTAVLQRRGLFDFVSPFTIFLAVLGYVLFAAFALYVEQNPFPGYAGALFKIGGVTGVYALMALFVYAALYRIRRNPFETHADRIHTIGMGVKFLIYTCIAGVVFVSLDLTLAVLELQRWELFAMSVFYVACALLSLISMTSPPRHPEAGGLGSSPVS